MATLQEIETSWNIEDIMQADALLDYEADQAYLREQEQKRRRRQK